METERPEYRYSDYRHNVQETLSITDRAYLLFEGKILFQGTPEELAENKIVREKYLSNSFVLRRKDFMV